MQFFKDGLILYISKIAGSKSYRWSAKIRTTCFYITDYFIGIWIILQADRQQVRHDIGYSGRSLSSSYVRKLDSDESEESDEDVPVDEGKFSSLRVIVFWIVLKSSHVKI
jgi:hypothetical protein